MSDLALAILAVLRAHGPCYGLQIRDILVAEGHEDPGQGIYSVLHDLERGGFVTSEERQEGLDLRGGRPRVYYHLTGKRPPEPDLGGLVPAY